MFPILNPPPSSLPVSSLWVVPVHQPQASSIVHWTWTGDSFHIWYYTCFNAILPNHLTLSLSHRVQKTVLYISVSSAVSKASFFKTHERGEKSCKVCLRMCCWTVMYWTNVRKECRKLNFRNNNLDKYERGNLPYSLIKGCFQPVWDHCLQPNNKYANIEFS